VSLTDRQPRRRQRSQRTQKNPLGLPLPNARRSWVTANRERYSTPNVQSTRNLRHPGRSCQAGLGAPKLGCGTPRRGSRWPPARRFCGKSGRRVVDIQVNIYFTAS